MPDLTLALRELERELLPFRRLIQAIDDVRAKAFCDDLTPLGNGRALRQAFEDAIAADIPQFVAFGDLTGFKAINDSYGHDAGDAVIRAVGKWLHRIATECEISAFRKTGDEFVLLGELTLLESVSAALELDIPAVHIDGRVISVEASFGTATVDFAPDTAIKNAETACTCAKQRGIRVLAWDGSVPAHVETRWRCSACNASIRVECQPGTPLKCPACGFGASQ